jgi:methionyl aminopeptidase
VRCAASGARCDLGACPDARAAHRELFHCAPNIPHYGGNKAVGIMRPGMVFTIEPMINAGTWKDTTWPDGWTSVTTDGKRSAQFEHTMLVTETGVEVLTARTPESPPLFPFA